MRRPLRWWWVLVAGTAALVLACGAEEGPECVDATCTTPPPPACSGDVLLEYAPTGTCIGDDCRYAVSSTTCPSGCAAATTTTVAQCATP